MKYIKIKNAENKRIAKVICADSFFLRLRGLIGRNLTEGEGLLLVPCRQVHTFMMNYAIDVVFLSETYTVLKIDESMMPKKIGPYIKEARYVLELPAGESRKSNISCGENLIFY